MCDPTGGLATAAIVMSVAGAGMSAMGAANQASAQQSAYNYQAQTSASNATIAQEQESQALTQGATDQQTQQLKDAQLYSTQRAAMASNGVDISSSGSAQDILATTKYLGTRDELQIHDNALRTAWGYGVQATNASNSSNFYTAAANNINPTMSGLSAGIGGASQVASKWYSADSAGAFGSPGSGAPTGVTPTVDASVPTFSGSAYPSK